MATTTRQLSFLTCEEPPVPLDSEAGVGDKGGVSNGAGGASGLAKDAPEVLLHLREAEFEAVFALCAKVHGYRSLPRWLKDDLASLCENMNRGKVKVVYRMRSEGPVGKARSDGSLFDGNWREQMEETK